jgi:hypothetical protein
VLHFLFDCSHKSGTEAMFADLGHFNVRAVQVSRYNNLNLRLFFFILLEYGNIYITKLIFGV